MRKESVIFAVAGIAVLIGAAALFSSVCLGDENYHYRLAKLYYTQGRPAADPVYAGHPRLGYVFSDGPFWYAALACIWKIAGGPGPQTAQAYQLAYLILLLGCTYRAARLLYDGQTAAWALLLLVTMPAVALLSIVLYVDLPLTALAMLAFMLLLERRFFLAGCAAGLMVLTKLNALLVLPGLLLFSYLHHEGSWKERMKRAFLFLLPAVPMNVPDIIFRHDKLGFIYYTPPSFIPAGMTYYSSPGSLSSQPLNAVLYFGVVLIAFIAAYILTKSYAKKELSWWIIVGIYIALWAACFKYTLDARYLLVIAPFLALAAARGLIFFTAWRWTASIIMVVCLIQFSGALLYVFKRRHIPAGILQGYQYIREHVPEGGVILYPGEDMVTNTGRPIAWGRVMTIAALFWGSAEEARAVLSDYDIGYVVIRNDRIYDDAVVRHAGGYPRSFVQRLSALPFLVPMYGNADVSIWQVKA